MTTVLNDVEVPSADPTADDEWPSPDSEQDSVRSRLAEVLAGVLDVDRVSPDSNFFDELDADSMVMARFCARVRKRHDLPAVSMKDVYRNPTISTLASALDRSRSVGSAALPSAPASAPASASARILTLVSGPVPDAARRTGRSARYLVCGGLQALK
jgi:acyl carrier protein